MSSKREVVESPQEQGILEVKPWTVTVPSSWGTVTSVVSVTLELINPNAVYTDVSSTNLSGSNSYSGQVITTKASYDLTANKDYRLGVKFTCGSTTHEVYLIIKAKK